MVPGDSDVTFLSPASAPGVLDQVEIFALLSSVSNGQNAMVQTGRAAVRVIKDAALIKLK